MSVLWFSKNINVYVTVLRAYDVKTKKMPVIDPAAVSSRMSSA
jgi:hypothetical protein